MTPQSTLANILAQAVQAQTPQQGQTQQAAQAFAPQEQAPVAFAPPVRQSETTYASIRDALTRQTQRADAESAFAVDQANKNYGNIAAQIKKSADQALLIEKQRTAAAAKLAEEQRAQQVTAADMVARETARKEELTGLDKSIRGAIEERKAMTIDRRKGWSNMAAGDKARSVIGVILGGIGQALTGASVNPGLAMLEQYLDDDVQKQKSAIDAKDIDIQEQKNLYQKNLQQLGDEREAALMTRALLRESYLDELDGIAKADESQQRRANAQLMAQQIRVQQENDIASILGQRDQKVVRNLQMQSDLVGREQSGNMAQIDALMKASEQNKKSNTTDIPGMERTKEVSEDDAKTIKKLKGTHSQLTGINERVRALRKKIETSSKSSTVLPDELAAEARGWTADLTAAVKEFKNMGSTFTDYEIALTEAMTYPSATSWKRVMTSLNRFQDSIDMELHTRAQAYGYRDVKISPKFDREKEIKDIGGERVD